MATMYDLKVNTGTITTQIASTKYTATNTWTLATGSDYYVISGSITNPKANTVYVVEVDDTTNYAYVYVDTTTSSSYAFAITFEPVNIRVYEQI